MMIRAGILKSAGGATDPNFSSVQLLLRCDGTDGATTFTDFSSAARSVTANGNAQIDTAIVKYGSAACLLDGTGDFLSVAHAAAMNLGSGAFTVEAWVYVTGGGADRAIWDCVAWDGTDGQHSFGVTSAGNVYFYYHNPANGFSNVTVTSSSTVSGSTWTHVAVTRSGTTLTLWINGVSAGTATVSAVLDRSLTRKIGATLKGGTEIYFQGSIDDFRLTVGVARYTSNFTAPTAAFPTG